MFLRKTKVLIESSNEPQFMFKGYLSAAKRDELGLFYSALEYARRWESTELLINGARVKDIYTFQLMLECYLESFDFSNPSHHCQKVIQYTPTERGIHKSQDGTRVLLTPAALLNKVEHYILPCKQAANTFRSSENWNLSMKDRFAKHIREQARHCFSCPAYREESFSFLGERPGLRLRPEQSPALASSLNQIESDSCDTLRHLPEPPTPDPEC